MDKSEKIKEFQILWEKIESVRKDNKAMELLDKLIKSVYYLLDDTSKDINKVERIIFAQQQKQAVVKSLPRWGLFLGRQKICSVFSNENIYFHLKE